MSPDHHVVNEDNVAMLKMEEPEVDDELEAVAKHFGKELDDITLEALVELEERDRLEGKDAGSDQPKREAPSLATILGLKQSLDDCVGRVKEDGERRTMLFKNCSVMNLISYT